MPHQRSIKSVVAGFVIAAICLLSFSNAAQQPGPPSKQVTVSYDSFLTLQQQIKQLKSATFRAFLRVQLLSWEAPEPSATRRQAALEVATHGLTDLCEHQDEIWPPTAVWLHRGFVKQIKALQSPDDPALPICPLKTDTNSATNDLSSGIRMLVTPETTAAGLTLSTSAILSGQVSSDSILGKLIFLKASHPDHLPELLSAVLTLEENQPGTLSLQKMPFFASLFLEKSVPTEIQTRFLSVAVRSTRVSAEELATIKVRSSVAVLLNAIINPAQQLAPALYPEIASRLSSLNRSGPTNAATRLAAEERIQKASDQLEQLLSEANAASDEQLKKYFLSRAAQLAKEQGQLSKAVDLALKVANDGEQNNHKNSPSWMNSFLSEIVSLAIKKESPRDATYAISKMIQPLGKATAFRSLGEYYGEKQDKVKSKEAFTQSIKQLKSVESSNEKVRNSLALAESVLKYEPVDAYEVFRESVRAINNLPSPEKGQEKMYYVHLLPVADDLIRSFRLLASRENQTATSLAGEIEFAELRLSALSGAYSTP